MRRLHYIIMAVAFLMSIIAIYFGIKVQNANTNFHIEHLNVMDHIHYSDVADVPKINFTAALFLTPFILALLVMHILTLRKRKTRQPKNIAIGLLIAVLGLLGLNVAVIFFPFDLDFSMWGYIYAFVGFFIFGGNLLSAFIPEKSAEN